MSGGWPGPHHVVSGLHLCSLPPAVLCFLTTWRHKMVGFPACWLRAPGSASPQNEPGFKGRGRRLHPSMGGVPQNRWAYLKTATPTPWHAKFCWPQPEPFHLLLSREHLLPRECASTERQSWRRKECHTEPSQSPASPSP